MSQVRTPTDSVMGALKELVAQSERVAKAEARLAIARYTDTARLGARRVGMLVVGGGFGCFAFGYFIYAGFLGLTRVLAPWQSALVVACTLSVAASLLIAGARGSDEKKNELSLLSPVTEAGNG
jgi:Putative Actinobacterial Holin-X, holin superfamily III